MITDSWGKRGAPGLQACMYPGLSHLDSTQCLGVEREGVLGIQVEVSYRVRKRAWMSQETKVEAPALSFTKAVTWNR